MTGEHLSGVHACQVCIAIVETWEKYVISKLWRIECSYFGCVWISYEMHNRILHSCWGFKLGNNNILIF
jgi:hypothetical protein